MSDARVPRLHLAAAHRRYRSAAVMGGAAAFMLIVASHSRWAQVLAAVMFTVAWWLVCMARYRVGVAMGWRMATSTHPSLRDVDDDGGDRWAPTRPRPPSSSGWPT